MSLLALLACAPEPPGSEALAPETEAAPRLEGAWSLAEGWTLELGQGLWLRDATREELVAVELVGLPAVSADGTRLAFSHRGSGLGLSVLETLEVDAEGARRRRVEDQGAPDRVALSPDGAWLAWVSGRTGIASVWAAPFDGGEPLQLTNVGLEQQARPPGQPPAGFVPPPHAGPLRVVGDQVLWESPEGDQGVELP